MNHKAQFKTCKA